MTETVTFQSEQTGQEAPKAPENKTPAAASGERPAWLPEQFKTVEDFVKSANETKAELTRLQQQVAKGKPAEGEQTTGESKDGQQPPKDGLGIEESTSKEGEKKGGEEKKPPLNIDFAPYQQEFTETGDVSPENRAKIAEQLKSIFGENAEGIVNDYIDGAKTRLANTTSQLKAIAGGDEGYAAMQAWAKDNLTPAEKEAYNRAVHSGDFHAASFAVQGLAAKFQAANGKAPSLIQGNNTPTGGETFKSLHEMKQAIADPRYKTDPDYRKQVEQKAMRSNI